MENKTVDDFNKLCVETMQELDNLVMDSAEMALDVGQLMADDYFNLKVRKILTEFYDKEHAINLAVKWK